MYDHGLKQPDDGTDDPFFKGECDASYDPDTQRASLSYILWKDNKIIHSDVFPGVQGKSASEAEIYAALALLYKAEELKCRKLLLCCDSQTMIKILNGVLSINMNHEHHYLYLKVRSMRLRFHRLVVSWNPRELMVFADALAKSGSSDKSVNRNVPSTVKAVLQKWSSHLQGLPVYRLSAHRNQLLLSKNMGKLCWLIPLARLEMMCIVCMSKTTLK